MKVVYLHLGRWESHDFAEAARYLATKSWADGSRVAIMGTSYGGYSPADLLLSYPGVFPAGIANTPRAHSRRDGTTQPPRSKGLARGTTPAREASAALQR